MEETVYYNLHTYAFSILKKATADSSLTQEQRDLAKNMLMSSQVDYKSPEAKNSIYHNIVTKYIVTLDKDLLSKKVNELSLGEKMKFDAAKTEIQKKANDEIRKNKVVEKIEEQNKEKEKAKEELKSSDVSVIENNNGTQFAKVDGVQPGDVVVAEMVGNTTLNEMIDSKLEDKNKLEDSFIIDGSSIQSIKSAEEIKDEFKKDRITNDSTVNLNTTNTDGLNNEQQEKIGVLKSSGVDLDGAKFDTTTNLAFTNDGQVLDAKVNKDGEAVVTSLNSGTATELPKQKTINNQPSTTDKLSIYQKIEDMYNKGLSREEAKAMLDKMPEFNNLSEEAKQNIYNSFTETVEIEKTNEKTYVPTLKPDNNINSSGLASSIIISFVSGIISGVIIMVLVFFFMSH